MRSILIRKPAGGRPPKFNEKRRPITVTLPERALRVLEAVSKDRAKAIVKCVETAVGIDSGDKSAVQLVEVLPGKALIVIRAGHSLLAQIEWLRLVEIAPARHILVLPVGMPIERLEVELQDLLESLPAESVAEHNFLERLRVMIVSQRRKKSISKAEFLLVDI